MSPAAWLFNPLAPGLAGNSPIAVPQSTARTAIDGEDRTYQKREVGVAGRSPLFQGGVCRPEYGYRSRITLISASSAFWRRVRFETTEIGCAEDSAHRLRFVGQTVVRWTHMLRDRLPLKPFYVGGLHLISSSINIYLPPTFLSNIRVSRLSNSITTSAKKASEALI